jgi:hypothetical protein
MSIILLEVIFTLTIIKPTLCQNDTAVLLVGGGNPNDGTYRNKTVELYGCSNVTEKSLRVADFPTITFQSSGIYRNDTKDVLVCGGMGNCTIHDDKCPYPNNCYLWNPQNDSWSPAPNLMNPTGNQLIVMHKVKGKRVPLVIYGRGKL